MFAVVRIHLKRAGPKRNPACPARLCWRRSEPTATLRTNRRNGAKFENSGRLDLAISPPQQHLLTKARSGISRQQAGTRKTLCRRGTNDQRADHQIQKTDGGFRGDITTRPKADSSEVRLRHEVRGSKALDAALSNHNDANGVTVRATPGRWSSTLPTGGSGMRLEVPIQNSGEVLELTDYLARLLGSMPILDLKPGMMSA